MELNKEKFAKLFSGVSGGVYLVCTLFVWAFPEFSNRMSNWVTHTGAAWGRVVTLGGSVAGLIEVLVFAYAMAWLFAWTFNKSVKK